MRRSLVAFSLSLVLCLAARAAIADDWKWDPKVKAAAPKVGDKDVREGEDYQKMSMKVSVGEQVVQNEKKEATTTYRYTREVIAVDGKHVSEQLVKIAAWKQVRKDEDPDTTLEGHTVRVKTLAGAKTATIEDDKEDKVSDEAKKWVDSELAKKKKKGEKDEDDDEDGEMRKLFPTEPVADGAEWKPDVAKVAESMEIHVDPAKSSAKASLTKVHVENGVHMGHLEFKLSLALVIPSVTWTDGGVMEMTVAIDTSLERDKLDAATAAFEAKFSGKGEAVSPQGNATLKQNLTEKHTMTNGPEKK